jgi:hypothetical protein
LDVIAALNDEDLTQQEKVYCALSIFYNFNIPENAQKAADEMMKFISCGENAESSDKPPSMNWEQDFNIIVAPINKALGTEIRAMPYLHWYTFVSAYMELGECQFSHIINIRQKKQKGTKLEKWEQEFYNENKSKIDLKVNYTSEEKEFMKNIFGE